MQNSAEELKPQSVACKLRNGKLTDCKVEHARPLPDRLGRKGASENKAAER